MAHFNIPVFIPEVACPFRCVYCNQYTITGNLKAPSLEEVKCIVERHLSTLQGREGRVEVAFFGGSFTGLDIKHQNSYLETVQPWIENGAIEGIRISTRPDYISEKILQNLKKYHVTAVELGAQSLDDDVLKNSNRGHTAKHVKEAAAKIKNMGFELGLQMMTGLPGDSPEKSMQTAMDIIDCEADTTRIYPTLVIRDTPLAHLYEKGLYKPQTLEEAIDMCAIITALFHDAGVKVLRTGLHPSEGFFNGNTLVDGPFHPAFGELVGSRLWMKILNSIEVPLNTSYITITFHPSDLNMAIGHKAQNRKSFHLKWPRIRKIKFIADATVKKYSYHVDYH